MIKKYTLSIFVYWITSSLLAVGGYYLLLNVIPQNRVFGYLFRMFPYHQNHPVPFILIPCFFYGIFALRESGEFYKKNRSKQIISTLKIILLTILISCPFGGMLYFYYDMQAGYFPSNWIDRMLKNGTSSGLSFGWLIILSSIPYNILGIITCYFLTRKGSKIYNGL